MKSLVDNPFPWTLSTLSDVTSTIFSFNPVRVSAVTIILTSLEDDPSYTPLVSPLYLIVKDSGLGSSEGISLRLAFCTNLLSTSLLVYASIWSVISDKNAIFSAVSPVWPGNWTVGLSSELILKWIVLEP